MSTYGTRWGLEHAMISGDKSHPSVSVTDDSRTEWSAEIYPLADAWKAKINHWLTEQGIPMTYYSHIQMRVTLTMAVEGEGNVTYVNYTGKRGRAGQGMRMSPRPGAKKQLAQIGHSPLSIIIPLTRSGYGLYVLDEVGGEPRNLYIAGSQLLIVKGGMAFTSSCLSPSARGMTTHEPDAYDMRLVIILYYKSMGLQVNVQHIDGDNNTDSDNTDTDEMFQSQNTGTSGESGTEDLVATEGGEASQSLEQHGTGTGAGGGSGTEHLVATEGGEASRSLEQNGSGTVAGGQIVATGDGEASQSLEQHSTGTRTGPGEQNGTEDRGIDGDGEQGSSASQLSTQPPTVQVTVSEQGETRVNNEAAGDREGTRGQSVGAEVEPPVVCGTGGCDASNLSAEKATGASRKVLVQGRSRDVVHKSDLAIVDVDQMMAQGTGMQNGEHDYVCYACSAIVLLSLGTTSSRLCDEGDGWTELQKKVRDGLVSAFLLRDGRKMDATKWFELIDNLAKADGGKFDGFHKKGVMGDVRGSLRFLMERGYVDCGEDFLEYYAENLGTYEAFEGAMIDVMICGTMEESIGERFGYVVCDEDEEGEDDDEHRVEGNRPNPKGVDIKRKLRIRGPPAELIITPDRTKFGKNSQKDKTVIDGVSEIILKKEWFSEPEEWEDVRYCIKAFSLHVGSNSRSGHFISYVRVGDKAKGCQ